MLVTPTVLCLRDGEPHLDAHFANNLAAYLAGFGRVTVACPAVDLASHTVPLSRVPGGDRCRVIVMPMPYREDRYLLQRRRMTKLLRDEIARSDYPLLAPHAPFDWPTLAGQIAVEMGRDYALDADWHLENVLRFHWSQMPPGPNKLRKHLWLHYHTRAYLELMRGSSVALLQGAAVFDAYRDVAPHPKQVLNVQISDEDRIPEEIMAAKVERIRSGAPLRIVYAGRAIPMKGPLEWIEALRLAAEAGVAFEAVWFGDGELLPAMKARAEAAGLSGSVRFPGSVPRTEVMTAVRDADMFLFCHQTEESPRCLVEAIASGSPIVGYSSQYARDLVDTGETFVERGDVRTLAERLARLDADRGAMARLARAALQSSLRLDRDAAIFERVRLVKEFMPLGQSGEPAGSGTAAAARQARGADPTLAVAD